MDADDQAIHLKTMGMMHYGDQGDRKLSPPSSTGRTSSARCRRGGNPFWRQKSSRLRSRCSLSRAEQGDLIADFVGSLAYDQALAVAFHP